ncbi:SUMF1/EgtB/PvdO family nonheme iron enzyme [Planctomycetota bacterium]
MSWMFAIATKVAATIIAKLVVNASRQIRTFLNKGDAEKRAMAGSIEAGVLCMLQAWEDQELDSALQMKPLLLEFLNEPEVCRELEALLTAKDWHEDNLVAIFGECREAQAVDIPGDIDVRYGLHIFKAAFLANAFAEPVLQELIKLYHHAEQTELQKTILAELQHLPALVEKLPGTQINAENVVSGVQLIINQIQGPGIPENKLEAVYLNAFCSQCDAVDLSITDDKYTHDDEHAVSLSQIFTRLYLEGIIRYEDESVAQSIKNGRKHRNEISHKPDREKQAVPVTALEAIGAVDRLVITGQPGGGKSTLVNYLFVQLAQARLEGKTVDGWTSSHLLPVRIILRKFARWIPDDATEGQAGLIWDYLAFMICAKKGQAGSRDVLHYVRKTLEQEGGIIFFDGLDEVGYGAEVSKRDVIKQAVVDFSSQLRQSKIVITSRPYAYRSTDSWRLPEADYPVVDLALFNKDQVKGFAGNWYQKVGKTVKGWDEARCLNMTKDFIHAVDTREGLFAIVTNPLLLTMAVQLHSRDNFLPHRRADLYQKVIELLLARWENNIVRDSEEIELDQGSDSIPRLQLSLKKMLKVLARVAFNCHAQQLASGGKSSETADISRGDLFEELEQDFGTDIAGKIIEYIQYRAGILQGKDNRTISFMHRTFQEYLAARHILELDDYDVEICKCLDDVLDWWQEVFLLMAGGAETRRAATIRDLVEKLLAGKKVIKDFATDTDNKKLLLAAQTLWETNYLDECVGTNTGPEDPYYEIYDRVHTCLEHGLTAKDQLASSQRALVGNWLARLGDHRPEVLDSTQMVFCKIPQGDFWLGDGEESDCPQALCKELNYDYWLSTYPVTVSQFKQFSDAGGYQQGHFWSEAIQAEFWKNGKVKFYGDHEWRGTMPDLSSRFNYMNHPMVQVSWFESVAYCRWLTERFLRGDVVSDDLVDLDRKFWYVTLPSEIEWEKAARGSKDKRKYPFARKINPKLANFRNTGIGSTSAVGCFPGGASPCGCLDMAGNVWEWCRNTYKEYPYICDDRDRVDKSLGSGRVFRGGRWDGFCRVLPLFLPAQDRSGRPARSLGLSCGSCPQFIELR